MMKTLKLLIVIVCVFLAAGSFAQKKKKHTTSKSSSGKSSSGKHTSGKHSSSKGHHSSKSHGKKGSSKKGHGRKGRHHRSYADEGGEVRVIKGESSSINWIDGGEALTFMLPTSYLSSHAFVRNTTDSPIVFFLYHDGHWTEQNLPAKLNADYPVGESVKFRMEINGKEIAYDLYPAHFYNILADVTTKTTDLKDVTTMVQVEE